jgi:hypothetical protein
VGDRGRTEQSPGSNALATANQLKQTMEELNIRIYSRGRVVFGLLCRRLLSRFLQVADSNRTKVNQGTAVTRGRAV